MSHAHFKTNGPVLWFKVSTIQAKDDLPGIPPVTTTTFQSALTEHGDSFSLLGNKLFHVSKEGKLSRASLRTTTNALESRDAILSDLLQMAAAGEISTQSIIVETSLENEVVGCPPATTAVSSVERPALSAAFVEMMDATEEFRLNCFEAGTYQLMYRDYGASRSVAFSLSDAETGDPIILVEADPAFKQTKITVPCDDLRAAIAEKLQPEKNVGISILVEGWTAREWSTLAKELGARLMLLDVEAKSEIIPRYA
jgi:hypothetical protein